jgi:hypothetical protein
LVQYLHYLSFVRTVGRALAISLRYSHSWLASQGQRFIGYARYEYIREFYYLLCAHNVSKPSLFGLGAIQRTLMYKEAQAAPSPSPIGFIRGECGSRTRIVCYILLQEQKLTDSEMVWGAWDSVDLTRDRHLTDTPARDLHSMFLIFFCIS